MPARTPREVVNRLQQEIVKVLAEPSVKERLTRIGMEPVTSTPDEFDALIRRELEENSRMVNALGIKAQ